MRIFRKGFLSFILMASAIAATASAAPAQTETYLTEYRLYRDAFEAGDLQRASRHAYAAWQAAEKALGDHKTTATLAYNYGQQMLFDNPESAALALYRAKTLLDAGFVDLPAEDLVFYLAYTRFITGRQNMSDAKALHEIGLDREATVAAPNYETSRIWLALATYFLDHRRWRYAGAAAANAEKAIAIVLPDDYLARGQALLINATAHMMDSPRTPEGITAAHEDLVRAQRLFPLQTDIVTFDGLLAQILAWDMVAYAIIATDFDEATALRTKLFWSVESHIFADQEKIGECRGIWLNREPPSYPRKEHHLNRVGGALIGYNVGTDGRVRDARILAEVPNSNFGPRSLESMKEWLRDTPFDPNPRCNKNQLARFYFYLY